MPENTFHDDDGRPIQIVVEPEFAKILADRRARREAASIAAGHGPLTDKSPFISSADLEKQRARAKNPPRGRLARAARLKITVRSQSNPSFARHARKCAICRHPEINHIESDFISWRSETTITRNYKLPSRSTVYRHATAAGLIERRRLNLRGVCERIIERVDEAPPSGLAVLRALRIYSQITEDGNWIDPPKHSLVTHVHVSEQPRTIVPNESHHKELGPSSPPEILIGTQMHSREGANN